MLLQRNVNCFVAPLHSTTTYIVCMARDRLGRRDNHDDLFASPVYLPCITACTLVFTHSLTPLAMFCRRRPLCRQFRWLSCGRRCLLIISHRVSRPKNIARYRYYPIYANIAQFPITQYRYRSNPNVLSIIIVGKNQWQLCSLIKLILQSHLCHAVDVHHSSITWL